MLLVDLEREAS